MGWPYVLLAVLFFAVVPAAGALFVYRLPGRPAKVLCGLLLTLAWWGLAYSLQLSVGSLSGKVLWESVKYVGVVAAPFLWLVFALQYTGRDRLLSRGVFALLAVFPVLTLFLVFTNSMHGLMWEDAALVSEGSVRVLSWEPGPWFWVVVAYSYGFLLLGAGPMISVLLGHHRLYRMQSTLLLMAVLFPWVLSGLNLLQSGSAVRTELTPLGFPVATALFLLGIRRFRLLDIYPIARDTAAEGMDTAIIVLDSEYRVVDLNPAAERILGKRASEVIGQANSDIVRGSGMVLSGTREMPLLELYKKQEKVNEEITLVENGERRAYNLVLSPLRDEQNRRGEHLMLLHDVTVRKVVEDRLEHLAHYDALTGLPNRRLFYDRVERALALARRRKKEIAVLFLDLDGFKEINDTLGHDTGDMLLNAVAAHLTDCVRESDTVSRLAGDEFTVLLPEVTEASEAAVVAEKIVEAFSTPFDLGAREVFVTSSVGVCLYPDGGDDPDELIKGADTAMYRAKMLGKGRYEFFEKNTNPNGGENVPTGVLASGERDDFSIDLQNDALKVYYQPIVRLSGGKIWGAEALVRWEHRERGLLLPSEFLAAAETSGSIVTVGRSVLREACLQAKRWRVKEPSEPPIKVCVNVSITELQTPTLHREVAEILADTGIDAGDLTLEVGEGSVLEDPDVASFALERLKDVGVRLALDDFGSGHASLGLLGNLPIDVVKLGRSLIDGMENEAKDKSLVAAIVGYAHDLGLEVVGVGIENPQQLAALSRIGCDMVQGYYLSRAVPPNKVSEAVRLIDHYFNDW